jgi:hypothetical protein
MAEHKAQITIRFPLELANEIEAFAGPRKRNAFIVAAAGRELRRRKVAAVKSAQIQAQEAAERLSVN